MGMEFPKGGLIGRARTLWRQVSALRIPIHAAHTGYFLILSVFPALVLLLSLLRSTSLDIHSLLRFLEGFIPHALLPEAELLIIDVYEETSGAWLGISALTALWSSSRGMYGLLTGLNAIYHVPETGGISVPGCCVWATPSVFCWCCF